MALAHYIRQRFNTPISVYIAFSLTIFVFYSVFLQSGRNSLDFLQYMELDDGPYVSTCSRESDHRGAHQKVIAYSIFGNLSDIKKSEYYLGCFKVTLKAMPKLYPGWIVRIYHNIKDTGSPNWKILQDHLPVERDHIDLCNATEIIEQRRLGIIFPMTWRFIPAMDELVDFYMSRDSDSLLLAREQAAVNEWLTSNRTFHIMRDNPSHCVPMLGGMWGAKLNQDRINISLATKEMLQLNHTLAKGFDQTLLWGFIWPIAKHDMIAHDSHCGGFEVSRPFPLNTHDGKFVGEPSSIEGCAYDS